MRLDVTMNFIMSGGSADLKTLDDVTMYDNSFAQGATQGNYTSFKALPWSKKNAKFALGAAINAIGYSKGIQGFTDISGGADSWDGIDLIASNLKNNHRLYTWNTNSKDLLLQYKKQFNGGVNVGGFNYKKSGYQISATKVIGRTLYTDLEGGRGERTAYKQ